MAIDIVGAKEVAERLVVAPGTVHQWSKRGILPPPEGTVSGAPAWSWPTIEAWARSTGRLPGMREQVLRVLSRRSSSTTPIAGEVIAAGYARSIGQVWRVLNDLMDEMLVGRTAPDSWTITEAGRAAIAEREPAPIPGRSGPPRPPHCGH